MPRRLLLACLYAIGDTTRKDLRRINPSATRPTAIKAQVPGSGTDGVTHDVVATNPPMFAGSNWFPAAPEMRSTGVVARGVGVAQARGNPRQDKEFTLLNAKSLNPGAPLT
jgi:hypothetical protein